MSKDLKILLKECRYLGCNVTKRNNNHYEIQVPTGAQVFLSGTPSDGKRAIKNIKSELRRKGLHI